MSLTTEEAIEYALSNIENALLCLIDAYDIDINEEKEKLVSAGDNLAEKLREYQEQMDD